MTNVRIDPGLCNGCGICVKSCPADVIRMDTPIGIPNMLGRNKEVPDDLKVLVGPGRGRPEINAEGDKIPNRPAEASHYGYTYLERKFEAHAGRAPIYTPTPTGNKEVVGGACLGMSLRKADGIW